MIIEFIYDRIWLRSASQVVAAGIALLLCAGACSGGGSATAPSAPTVSPVTLFDRSARQQAAFTSPDNNVSCSFTRPSRSTTEGAVRCEIVIKLWQPPAKPTACDVDWGFGVTLDTRAQLLCAGDTVRGDAGAVKLPYGTAIRFSPLVCVSQRTGIVCDNAESGAGFLIGRKTYELRNP